VRVGAPSPRSLQFKVCRSGGLRQTPGAQPSQKAAREQPPGAPRGPPPGTLPVRWFSTLVAKNANFDDAKLVVPAADLDGWTFQARGEGPDEGTKQQNRSEIGLDGVQRRRKVAPRRGSKIRIIPRCESFVRGRLAYRVARDEGAEFHPAQCSKPRFLCSSFRPKSLILCHIDVNARNSAEQQLKQWETQSLVSDSATIKIHK
jgi:hypothetical protein